MVSYYTLLHRGNDLCKKREMSPKLIGQVKDIYQKCLTIYPQEIPLIDASRQGFGHMVWGFIECAKETGKDLQTGETLDIQKFMGYKDCLGRTALHEAAEGDHVEVAIMLLEYVSLQHLVSYRDQWGKTPLSLLGDPKYDEYILKAFKAAEKDKVDDHLVLDLIDKKRQEPLVYTECVMDVNSYPKSHTNETRSSLNNLNKGVCELTPNRNTILHLVSMFGDVNYANDLLREHPSLIHHKNSDGDTPFFVASREGNIDILEILIKYVKHDELEKLAIRSTDKHNALHIAIENHHVGVVFWLVKEIPQLANHINGFWESPIYLAAERGYYHILKLILEECTPIAYEGPQGKTALHVAVQSQECTEYLLRENINLLKVHDKNGWTPLHYAVYHHQLDSTRLILEADPFIGHQMTTGNDINISPLHIAASRGDCDLVDLIISKSPGCEEIIDSKGRNILHVAVENKKTDVIYWIFRRESLTSVVNQRDYNGNTPLHLFMAFDLEMDELVLNDKVNIYVRNNEDLTPLDMASSEEKKDKLIKVTRRGIRKIANNINKKAGRVIEGVQHLGKQEIQDRKKQELKQVFNTIGANVVVVATLIATATFAAAFTVPGGFDDNQGSEQGMPILLKKAAFKAFVVANALAFTCSCCVLVGHIRQQLYLPTFHDLDNEEFEALKNIVSLQYTLIGIAMAAMGLAFITGSYVILTPCLDFAIIVCAIGLFVMVSLSVLPANWLRFAPAIVPQSVNDVKSSQGRGIDIPGYECIEKLYTCISGLQRCVRKVAGN